MQGIETLGQYFVEFQECCLVITCKKSIGQGKGIFVVQYVQVLYDLLIPHFLPAEGYGLVENRQRIPHGPVCLHGYDMQ